MKPRLALIVPLLIGFALVHSVLYALGQQLRSRGSVASFAKASQQTLQRRIGGWARAVAKQGDYAYLGIGSRLEVLDVSDPARPELLAQTDDLTDAVHSLSLIGNYAIAPGDYGLRIFDISDAEHPSLVRLYDLPSQRVQDTVISGTLVFLAEGKNSGELSGSGGLRILDLSDPVNPVQIGHYGDGDSFYSVAVNGNYAYVEMCKYSDETSCTSGLSVLNISDPGSPTEVDSWSLATGSSADLVIHGDYLYRSYSGDITVYDLDDPTSPSYVNTIYRSVSSLEISGNLLFGPSNFGLYVFDLSEPVTPTQYGHFWQSPFSGPFGVAVDGNRAYLPHGAAGMFVVDVSQPSLPEVGLYDTFGNPSDVLQVGDYLYLVDYYDDLHILSTTLPLSPTEVGRYHHQSWRWQLQTGGGDVFLVGSNGFEILDVSDPISPVQKSAYQTLSRLQELIVQGDYVYLAISEYYSSDSLQIVDISDRTQPTMTASTGFGCHSGVGVQVAGGYAFLAEDSYCSPQPSGLAIVNVSDPTQPQIVVSHTISGSLNGLAMLNDRLYLANDGYGIRIVDVTDPLSPTESGLYTVTNATGYGYDVHVVDGQLYVHTRLTDGSVAREILDVSDPDKPVKIGKYEYAVGLSLSQDDRHYIYRPLSSKGLYIFGEGTGTVPERNVYLPAVTR